MEDHSADSPIVSVIIPTYNRQDTIGQSIESVLAQSFDSFEVLVIDDGSTDDTQAIVDRLADSRIRYMRQEHSGLPAVARNNGIRKARGEYIAFLDSDDLWTKDKLAQQIRFMEERPEVGLSYTNTLQFTDDPARCGARPMVDKDQAMSGWVFDKLYGRQEIPNLTVIIRASVADEIGGLNEDRRLKGNEDYEYWLRIARHHSFGYLDKNLAKYRQHPGGISKSGSAGFISKLHLIDHVDELFPDVMQQLERERQIWKSEVNHHLALALFRESKYGQACRCLVISFKLDPRTFLSRSKAYVQRLSLQERSGGR